MLFSTLIGIEKPGLEMPDVFLAVVLLLLLAVRSFPCVSFNVQFDLTVCTEAPEVLFAGIEEFRNDSTESTAFELCARIDEAEVVAQISRCVGMVREPR